jgi:hypothetical protein
VHSGPIISISLRADIPTKAVQLGAPSFSYFFLLFYLSAVNEAYILSSPRLFAHSVGTLNGSISAAAERLQEFS